MIRIAICDDSKILAENLGRLISKSGLKEKYSIDTFLTGKRLLEEVNNNNNNYDILFMDIELENGINGTDVAVVLKKKYPNMLIVYLSSYNNYYEAMVQAEPFRFLKKPLIKESVNKVLKDAIERLKKYRLEYICNFNNKKTIVNLWEVMYAYSNKRQTYLHLINGEEIHFYKKLDIVEEEVNNICDFFGRANKSFLINLHQIDEFLIEKVCINEMEIAITKSYSKDFIGKFIKVRYEIYK